MLHWFRSHTLSFDKLVKIEKIQKIISEFIKGAHGNQIQTKETHYIMILSGKKKKRFGDSGITMRKKKLYIMGMSVYTWCVYLVCRKCIGAEIIS